MSALLRLFGFVHPLSVYARRSSQVAVWQACFPDDAGAAVRFLEIINKAFLLGKRERDKISPSDEILQLYRTCLGPFGTDSMELEHLLMLVEETFHVSFPDDQSLDGRTFGDLFREIRQRQAKNSD